MAASSPSATFCVIALPSSAMRSRKKRSWVMMTAHQTKSSSAARAPSDPQCSPFEGDSHVAWFEGNFADYEEDKKRRLGIDSVIPHRLKYKKFSR